MKYWYDGSLSSKLRSGAVKQAAQSYYDQRSRCYNKKHPLFSTHGANGLMVEYSCREFVGWWLENLSKNRWRRPVAGRIDHSLGYSFANIEMQESSDNSREAMTRNRKTIASAPRTFGSIVSLFKDNEPFCTFFKVKDAAHFLNCDKETIRRLATTTPKWTSFKYKVKYHGDAA